MRDQSILCRSIRLIVIVTLTLVLAHPALTQTYNVLYSFNLPFAADDSHSQPGMILNNGSLYGTVAFGGLQGLCCGQVFDLTDGGSGWTFSTLYSFNGNPEGLDVSGMDFAPDGNIYGTTFQGPIAASVFAKLGYYDPGLGCGTAFKLEQSPHRRLGAWSETLLYTFTCGNDGGGPGGDLAFDTAGNVYGVTSYPYGEYMWGTVYELSPSGSGWTQNSIHEFTGNEDGAAPTGLVTDRNGNLYGVAALGGDQSNGVVFQMVHSASGWTQNVIYTFQGGADGGDPWYGLVADNAGNLYGANTVGGGNGFGTVFELSPGDGGWTLTPLYSLNNGGNSELAIDNAGNLYGYGVVPGSETLYELTPGSNGWTSNVIHVFTCDTGCEPVGRPAIDANGNVYGMTAGGGTLGDGVFFEITP